MKTIPATPMCEHHHTKQEWNDHHRGKVNELENQINCIKMIEHLQATQLELTKMIRKGIEKEIAELNVLIEDDQPEDDQHETTNNSTQT